MTLKKFLITTLIVAVPALALIMTSEPRLVKGAEQSKAPETFMAMLNGGEEVPAVATTATGSMLLKVSSDKSVVHYTLKFKNIKGVTQAHLHCALPGENGTIIVPLLSFAAAKDMNGDFVSGTIELSDISTEDKTCEPQIQTIGELIQAMREGKLYVNVHTINKPQGEVRGRITKDNGAVATSTTVSLTATTTMVAQSTSSVTEQNTKTITPVSRTVTTTNTEGQKRAIALPGYYYVLVTPDSYHKIQGGTVSFTGSHFYPNENVSVRSNGLTLGSVTADSAGKISTGLYAIPFESGKKTYTFTGSVSRIPFGVGITITDANPWLKLSTYYAVSGTPITISGQGFGSSEEVRVTFGGISLGTVRTLPNGSFTLSSEVPAGGQGKKLIIATGLNSASTAQENFTQAY